MLFPPRAVLETDLSLIKQNGRLLMRLAEERFFCPMVKTDAYGHGAIPVTKALREAGALFAGTVSAEEARQIHETLPDPPNILIFGPISSQEEWEWIASARRRSGGKTCLPVISNYEDLECAKKAAAKAAGRTQRSSKEAPLPIHLKFDAGFSRLGFAAGEAEKIKAFLKDAPLLKLEGIALQLTEGVEADLPGTLSFNQRKILRELRLFLKAPAAHSLNTAALFALAKPIGGRQGAGAASGGSTGGGSADSGPANGGTGLLSKGFFPDKADDGARPGIGLYGPFAPALPQEAAATAIAGSGAPLSPAMRSAESRSALKKPEGGGARQDAFQKAVAQETARQSASPIQTADPAPAATAISALQIASSLKAYIVNIRGLKKGGLVSYSGTWRAKRNSIIATVSLGYGDGLLKTLSNKGRVLYRGRLCPVVGQICMDFFMTDITDADRDGPPPRTGEEILIFGSQKGKSFSAADQAALAGALPHELFAGLGRRVRRIYTENSR